MENQEKRRHTERTIVEVFIAALVIFYFFVWPHIGAQKIGSYPATRTKDGKLITLNRTIYKVNPSNNTIVYWMPGIDETPRRLINCAVRDRKNWSGYYDDGSGPIVMRKGRKIKPYNPHDPNETYVSRWRWWLMHFGIL